MNDSLVEFIGRVVKERFDSHSASTNGALLAELIRAELGENAIAVAGFIKLSEAVSEAAKRGLVSRNHAVKHLEVFPAGESVPSFPPTASPRSCYVRPDAWRAFAMQYSGRTVLFDTVSHQFQTATGQPTSDDNSIEVETPTYEDFRQWVGEFAQQAQLQVPSSVLESDSCVKDFSQWILSRSSTAVLRWKKFRAERVAQAIIKWAEENGIDTRPFFTPAVKDYGRQLSTTTRNNDHATEAIRRAVIACVQDMSLADLESLSIPVRHVRTYFQPR